MSKNDLENIIDRCTNGLVGRNLRPLKKLDDIPPKQWCSKLNKNGNTLLQECIINNKKKAFDDLLPFYTSQTLQTLNKSNKNALDITLCPNTDSSTNINHKNSEHFALKLIEKGASVEGHNYLHFAIELSLLKVVKLLLQKGLDVNSQNEAGDTPLHKALIWNVSRPFELVSLLLYYNADPFIENSKGFIPFEYSVKYNHIIELQEILFNYTFDKYTYCQISGGILLQLANLKSPLFYHLIELKKIKFVVKTDKSDEIYNLRSLLFEIETKLLKKLIEKCDYFLKEIFVINMSILSRCHERNYVTPKSEIHDAVYTVLRDCDDVISKSPYLEFKEAVQLLSNYKREESPYVNSMSRFRHFQDSILTDPTVIGKMSLLLESKLKKYMMDILSKVDSEIIFKNTVNKCSKFKACELLTFLLSYGLRFTRDDYETIYKSYSYCELFKLMLSIGSNVNKLDVKSTVHSMGRLIYDINFVFDDLIVEIQNPTFYLGELPLELLDYFAHPALENHLVKFYENSNTCLETNEVREGSSGHGDGTRYIHYSIKPLKVDRNVNILMRLRRQPKLPLLVELARNAVRKHLIKTFHLKNEREFYGLVKKLPVTSLHKEIITYEKKLYD